MKEDSQFKPIEKQVIQLVEGGQQEDLEALEQIFEDKKNEVGKLAIGTALHSLCYHYKTSGNHLDILNFLLMKKGDVNWRNMQTGITSLMICAKKGCSDLLDALLKCERIKVDCTDSLQRTALFYAVESDNGENVNIISSLIAARANINLIDSKGRNVLMIAIEKGNYETVKLLLENNVNIQFNGSTGDDVLTLARKKGN